MVSILPPNSHPMEFHIEAAVDPMPDPSDIALLHDPYACPVTFLPYLAWALDVIEWDTAWSETKQRKVIAASIPLHNTLGTVGALRDALMVLGYDAVKIIERSLKFRNGAIMRDAVSVHGSDMPAYMFDVQLNTGTSPTASELTDIRRVVDIYKNVRSHLRNIRYMTLHHNAVALRDSMYFRDGGVVNG